MLPNSKTSHGRALPDEMIRLHPAKSEPGANDTSKVWPYPEVQE
jgi:hypothetical protein